MRVGEEGGRGDRRREGRNLLLYVLKVLGRMCNIRTRSNANIAHVVNVSADLHLFN